METREEILDDLADEFCYELAAILRRILGLEEEENDDDDASDE
jgi:hypothetical protein